MKGIVIEKGEECYTLLKKLFCQMDNIQKKYNWLITDYECYPQKEKYISMLSGRYCFITGNNLQNMYEDEDFQWIWGVFSGFSQTISMEEILKYKLPFADGYKGFWQNPVSIQHPLAEIEIVSWDSSLTIITSKDNSIVEKLIKNNPFARDLEEYNK